MPTFELRPFEHSAHPAIEREYLRGQAAALAKHGVELSHVVALADAPGTVFFIPAIDGSGDMAGGVRLNLRTKDNLLPTERHLADEALTAEIDAALDDRPFEIGGGWVMPEYQRAGLLPALFFTAMCVARLHGCRVGFGSAHEKVAPAYEMLGATFDRSRVFAWPDERYRTFIARQPLAALLDRGGAFADSAMPILAALRKGHPNVVNIDAAQMAAGEGFRRVS